MQEWLRARDGFHFFEQINLFSKGFDQVRELVEAGEDVKALSVYRKLLQTRLSAPKKAQPEEGFLEKADLLMENKISLLNSELVDIGDPINWFLEPGGDKQWHSHLGYFYFVDCLLDAYDATGELPYLEKWMKIHNDFIKNHYWGVKGLEYDVSIPSFVNEKGYKYGGEGRTPDYPGGTWIALATATRIERFLASLSRIIDNKNVPDLFIGNILFSLVTDHFHVSLNNARRYTPNQFIHCANTMVFLGTILNEYKIAPAAYLIGMDRLEEALKMCVLPDGTDLEQSFNYNGGLPVQISKVTRLFEGKHNPRVDRLRKQVEQRCLYLTTMITPLNQMPALAKTHQGKTATKQASIRNQLFPLKQVEEIIGAVEQGLPCEIGSVAYPYGGYYVMRSGWNRTDNFLFFKTSRYAMGHAHEDCNSIVLTALGQNLLVDSGNYNYSGDALSKVINEYFTSSFAHNTVCVNGLSQSRLKTVAVNRDKVSEDWQAYEEYAAHLESLQERDGTRMCFEKLVQFAEGIYQDGYGLERQNAVHKRQVFSAANRFYIVVDRISGGSSYQLNWILSPECANTSFEDTILKTHASEVTLEIMHLGTSQKTFQIAKGQEQPFSGWMCTEYNCKVETEHVNIFWQGEGEQLSVSLLMPYQVKRPDVVVTQQEGGRVAFTVSDGCVTAECFFVGEDSKVCVKQNGEEETLLLTDGNMEFTTRS